MKVEDAAAKVKLIQTEIVFNQAVTSTLEGVQRLCQQLDAGRVALREGQVMKAIESLEETEKVLKKDCAFTNTNIMSILSENITELRREIVEFVRMRWSEQVIIDKQKGELQVTKLQSKKASERCVLFLLKMRQQSP